MSESKAVCLVRSSINVDEVMQVPHIVRPGETLSSTSVDRKIGGKGANVSAAIGLGLEAEREGAEASHQVFLAGSIGQDEWLLKELQGRGVKTESVVVRNDVKTGTAYIQVAEDGENSIILLKGANHASHAELDDAAKLFSRVEAQAGSPVTHLVLQNEIPLEVTKAMLRHSNQVGNCISVFNPSPMLSGQTLWDFEWNLLDVLIVNEGEARDMLESFGVKEWKDLQASQVVGALSQVNELKNIPWVVMTRGGQGVAVSVKQVEKHAVIEVPAGKPKAIKDTTGAGDTFAGYLVASLMREVASAEQIRSGEVSAEQAKELISLAAWAGALAVETPGAMVSIPKRESVLSRRST